MDDVPEETPAIPAATVILLRDQASGLETLMVRRSAGLQFGGMWVFPGGRIDPDDYPVSKPDDMLAAARRAAAREAAEEAGLVLDEAGLVPFSHWTPPAVTPKRFSTWFFVAAAPSGSVTVDGGEIHDHAWVHPAEALRRRDRGEIELAPPTWVSLHRLAGYADVPAAIADAEVRQPEIFATQLAKVDGGAVALYAGDAGYEDSVADRPGPRHRLWMLDSGWRYERSA
ncbi:MAG TPA: NUDIX domain-containing protein [Acidimicrobiales bacterium]|jgi:8-oxo-dGTP pyrophosphatase MutT (NUDIX family)